MTWQPIATAPTDGTVILLYSPKFDSRYGGVFQARLVSDYFSDGNEERWISDPFIPTEWTHWMPIPNPPTLAAVHTSRNVCESCGCHLSSRGLCGECACEDDSE